MESSARSASQRTKQRHISRTHMPCYNERQFPGRHYKQQWASFDMGLSSLILPATQGFFTPLNNVLKVPTKTIRLNNNCKDAIWDTFTLIHRLSKRPTHVNKLLPNLPAYVAYYDAAPERAGGVWFSLSTNIQPLLWRITFPRDITESLSEIAGCAA